MNWNLWKMYGKNFYIEFFILVPQYNVILKYIYFGEIEEAYLIAEHHLQIQF